MYNGLGRRRYGGLRGWTGLGRAVDILMPDGTWIRNRGPESGGTQDVANHIGMGADLYEPGGPNSKKLTLVFWNSTSNPNPSKYDPAVWSVQVPGGTGPGGSITLTEYLNGGGDALIPPTVVPPTTTGGGGGPTTGGPGAGGGLTDVVLPSTPITTTTVLPGTVETNLLPPDDSGEKKPETQQAGMPVLLGIGLLLFLAFRRK